MRIAIALGVLAVATTGVGALLALAAEEPPHGSFHVAPIAARDADRDAVVRGNAAFALDVYGSLRNDPGNLVFSPLSLSTALAMAAEGAAGATRRELTSVLHLGLRPGRMGRAFQSVLADLAPVSADVRFEVANGAWAAAQVPFRPAFIETLGRRFGARVAELDFHSDPEAARGEINGWCADATHGMVPEVLPPGSVSADTALALADAIWFEGKWEQPFDARTSDVFALADGSRVPCPLMRRTGAFGRADGPGFRAVELPYRGEDLAMLVLVPDRADGLPGVEAALTPAQLSALTRELEPTYVDLWFPPFAFERHIDFTDTLQALGVTRAFDPRRADFSRAVADRPAWIGDVLQGASVRVDEEGTVAAAVTAIGFGVSQAFGDEPSLLRVDRPFLFLIRHRATGTILFVGRVEDPTR